MTKECFEIQTIISKARTLLLCLMALSVTMISNAQSFNSGSNGSDGALNVTTPGTIIFDPKTFTPPLNPADDNIFNFTTINIASGVTLQLTSKTVNGPVYFLATGAMQISGIIDLSGEGGHGLSNGLKQIRLKNE